MSRLHIPSESQREQLSIGELSQATDLPRPAIDIAAGDIQHYAHGLIRVLADDGSAAGDWAPKLSTSALLDGLKDMMLTRAYDDRMFTLQRQGKLSFYLKSHGEEACAVAAAKALDDSDMLFPSYRQQGLFISRGHAIEPMMCQCLSNSADPLEGKQLPILYSWKDGNIFSLSGNVATQVCQSVGWAMASAQKGETAISATWVGEGGSATVDVHHAMQFAATWRAPTLINIINNGWAISTPQSFANCGTTFAARAHGYNLPGLRVDGNDFLAVYAVTQWAAERARAGFGATVIELLSWRAEGHSSSDDPSAYREPQEWPLGDPIERLKLHLIHLRAWSQSEHDAQQAAFDEQVKADAKTAQSKGTLLGGPQQPRDVMFEDVYQDMPDHLRVQQQGVL